RDAEGKVVEAVGRAALLGPHEVCHESLLSPLGQAEVDAVDEEEYPSLCRRRDEGEGEIDGRVESPTRDDHSLASEPVREVSAEHGAYDLRDVKRGPQQRYERHADARLLRAQEQEGVRGVREREEGDDDEEALEVRVEAAER